VDKCYVIRLLACIFRLGDAGAISLEKDTTAVTIYGCLFERNKNYDVRIYSTTSPQPRGITIESCWFEHFDPTFAGIPIYCFGAMDVRIAFNHILQPRSVTMDIIVLDGVDFTYKSWRGVIVGNFINDGGTSVRYGIYLNFAADFRIIGNLINVGSNPSIYIDVNARRNVIVGNRVSSAPVVNNTDNLLSDQYGMKKSGTVTIPAGSTSVTFAHGLIAIPTKVIVTPRANIGNVWVSARDATNITINCSTAPSTNVIVDWEAEV
jgi:hypothetical protein